MILFRHSLSAIVAGLLLTTAASAASFSFNGSFTRDDDIRLFNFSLASSSLVTLQTLSYGGGTNSAGTVIPRGGFDPVISVFSPAGMLIDSVSSGSCPPQTRDSATGLCADAYLQRSLAAGNYTVALTEFFNVPNGPALSNGFLQAGTGNFTGGACGTGGAFRDTQDVNCGQRTANYALDIVNVTAASESAAAVPEPASVLMLSPALLVFLFVMQKRTAAACKS